MADLNVLGALSGISRASIKGLEYLRSREQQQEEKERQERDHQINLLKIALPKMDKKSAQGLLEQTDALGDDDKTALMAIAGTNLVSEQVNKGTIEDQLSQMQNINDPSITAQKKYDYIEGIIVRSNLNAAEQKIAMERAQRLLGVPDSKKNVGSYTFDQFYTDWQSPEADRNGLERLAKDIGHPEWVEYAGKTGRKPRSTPQGRTEEEIIDDQSRLISRRISVLERKKGELESEKIKLEEAEEPVPRSLIDGIDEVNSEYQHLAGLQEKLSEPEAKPFKNMSEAVKPPKVVKKKIGTKEATKELPQRVGKTILRKKAYQWLKKNAPDAIDAKELTEEQIKANLDAVIQQGLVE